MSSDKAPDSIQVVYGFRTWQLVDSSNGHKYDLGALSNTSTWNLDRKTAARCLPKRDSKTWAYMPPITCGEVSPGKRCECGLHAYHDPDALKGWVSSEGNSRWVAGIMLAWGRMYRHKHQGFRAQYAVPIGFLDTKNFYLNIFVESTGFPLFKTLEELEKYAIEREGVSWRPQREYEND